MYGTCRTEDRVDAMETWDEDDTKLSLIMWGKRLIGAKHKFAP